MYQKAEEIKIRSHKSIVYIGSLESKKDDMASKMIRIFALLPSSDVGMVLDVRKFID